MTVVCALKNMVVPYGVLKPGENGEVIGMEEKPVHPYFINTGLYVLEPGVIDRIPGGVVFHMPHLMEAVMKDGGRVGMYPVSGDSFLEIAVTYCLNRKRKGEKNENRRDCRNPYTVTQ